MCGGKGWLEKVIRVGYTYLFWFLSFYLNFVEENDKVHPSTPHNFGSLFSSCTSRIKYGTILSL